MNPRNTWTHSGKRCLLALALLGSLAARADDESPWYVGASIGTSQATIDDAGIEAALIAAGFSSATVIDDDHDHGYKLFAGYRFRDIAVEGGYYDLGGFGYTATTSPAGTLTGALEAKGWNIDLVGFWPMRGRWSLLGRVGYHGTMIDTTFAGTGAVVVADPELDEREGHFKFGGGLQYDLSYNWATRLEFERYVIGDTLGNEGDIDTLTLGMTYRFGSANKARTAPVAAAAVPAPVVVVVPVVAQTERYCTLLDYNFEINRDVVQREDLEKLNVVAVFMRDYPATTAVIQGFSDDVGSLSDNLALSQRRAQSVVDYLVDTQRIARSRLTAKGYGEGYPIGDNDTTAGQQSNRRISAVIACANDLAGLKAAPARMTMALEIEFDPYKSAVLPSSRDELREVADFLKANPTTTAHVQGHSESYLGEGADRLATDADVAIAVSQKRAQNVVDYLATEFGVARSRLTAEGFGQTRRVAYGTTLEGQQMNRRINIIIGYAK